MKYSDGMKLTYYLQAFKDITNNSKGQALLLKIIEDYLRMLIFFNGKENKEKVQNYIECLVGKDEEFLKMFDDMIEVVLAIKKLDKE